ncbi:MAG TPA: AraC family transcriptional regulator [Polyangiaceae bacterium]|nr:AraC family transcriptional regulator [Polyangiaceae bacterium]
MQVQPLEAAAEREISRAGASGPRTHTVLAAYARQIRDLLPRWHVAPGPLFGRAGIAEADIEDPTARVELGAMLALIDAARQATREPALGWYAGAQSAISMFGYLGFAMLTAPDVGAALQLLAGYANPLVGTAIDIRMEDLGGSKVALVLDEIVDLGPARDFVLGGLAATVWQIGARLTGARLKWSAELMIPEPPYFKRVLTRIPPALAGAASLHGVRRIVPPVRFAQPANRFVFDRACLALPLLMADAAAHRMAVQQCAIERGALATDLVSRVRHAVDRAPESSMENVARDLQVSPRTLRRQLADRGLTFSNLAAEVRRDLAERLLRTTAIPVAQIARQVGYATITSFVRAFHGWTGVSPGVFRKRGRG